MHYCKMCGWLQLRLVALGAVAFTGCSVLFDYGWEFRSGEQAIHCNPYDVGVSSQRAEEVEQKASRGEPLSGRVIWLHKGTPTTRVVEQCGQPLERRASARKGYDTEWDYDWWTLYFRRGRVADVRFKESTHEPEPIYRRTGILSK